MSAPFYDNEDFNEYLRQKVKNQRMYPSDQIWRNIQTTLHGQRAWPGLSVISIFIIAAITAGTLLTKPNNHLPKAQYHPISSINIAATEKQSSAATEILHQHFSSENITQQTITSMAKSLDNTGNDLTPLAAAGFNFLPLKDVAAITAPANKEVILQANAIKVKTPAAIAGIVPPAKEGEARQVAVVDENNSYLNNAILPATTFSFMSEAPMPKTQKHLLMQSSFSLNTRYAASYTRKYITLNFLNGHSSNYSDYRQRAKVSKLSIQLYATPSLSYRRLTDATTGSPAPPPSTLAAVSAANAVAPTVHNSPAIGMEAGFVLGYKITDQLTFKTGLQYNMRQYNIIAYNHKPSQTAAIGFLNNNSPDTINLVSNNNNPASFNYETTLNNRYYEVSIPLGIDWKVASFNNFSVGVAGFVQPTYTFDRHPFLITSDLKNYINGSSLLRSWNINTSVESYIAYKMGDYTWQIGPQVRYQQLPSSSGQYPIKEYLIDYGFKLGVTKAIR